MSRINNYKELVAERMRLEIKIMEQKEILNKELLELKEKLEPLQALRPILNIFNKKSSNATSLVSAIVSTGIDLIAGQGLSPKLNWLVQLAISFLAKKLAIRKVNRLHSNEYQPL
jgi:hypothetical protein